MTTVERRKCVRRSVGIPVEFIVQCNTYYGSSYNISDVGMFINVTGRFTVGEDISIISTTDQVSLHSAGNHRAGSIVWISPQGIGVKFRKP